MRILRRPDVLKITGLSASTLERMERQGKFPQRVRLSRSTVGWREDEIIEWVDSRDRGGQASLQAPQNGSMAISQEASNGRG